MWWGVKDPPVLSVTVKNLLHTEQYRNNGSRSLDDVTYCSWQSFLQQGAQYQVYILSILKDSYYDQLTFSLAHQGFMLQVSMAEVGR